MRKFDFAYLTDMNAWCKPLQKHCHAHQPFVCKKIEGDERTCWMRNSSISLFWRAIWAAKSLLNLVDRLELLFWLIWNCCCSSKDKQRPVETRLEWWVPVAGWGKSGCPEYWDVGTIISSLVLFPKFFLTANKKFKSYNKNHEFLLWGKNKMIIIKTSF